MGLEEDTRVGVDQVKGDGGPSPCHLREGPLYGGRLLDGEKQNDIMSSGIGHDLVVLGVVGLDLLD